jgi:hypothetical protein
MYHDYVDYLCLRAFISNSPTTLSTPSELDSFIQGCHYSEFLSRVSRDERLQASLSHKFTSGQILTTLEQYLLLPDSPLVLSKNRGHPPSGARPPSSSSYQRRPPVFSSPPRGPPPPAPAPVHTVDGLPTSPASSAPSDTSGGGATPPDTPTADPPPPNDVPSNGLSPLPLLVVPLDADMHSVSLYHAAIHRIACDPSSRSSQPYLICKGSHTFDGCPVLLNTTFLKNHFISYCVQVQKEQKARERLLQGHPPSPSAPSVAVGSIDHDMDDSWHEAHQEPSTPDWYDNAYMSVYGTPGDNPADFY